MRRGGRAMVAAAGGAWAENTKPVERAYGALRRWR